MTRRCWHKNLYHVSLNKWRNYPDGGGTNFMTTPSLTAAWIANRKLPVKRRQIDVRTHGQQPYVLKGSWK